MRTLAALAALAALVTLTTGCDGGDSVSHDCRNARCMDAAVIAPRVDAQLDVSVAPDAESTDVEALDAADFEAPDAAPPDAAPPDAAPPDAAPAPRCSAPPPAPLAPVAPLPRPDHRHPGVDPLEADAYATLRDHLLTEPGVHFVATHDRAADLYRVDGGPPDARAALTVRRVDDPDRTTYAVEGDLAAIFPRTDPAQLGYDALIAAYANPDGVELPGYPPGDPRVGWLPRDAQSWPDPIARIVTLFDAADAPDLVVGRWPHHHGGTGSHGGLGHLQSRAVFIVSGRGARRGAVIDTPARLVDAAPTALAALATPTTAGLGPDGRYDDHLYLRRQDGAVRWEALDPDPCVRPDHVIMVLFDGLLAPELNALALADDPPVELPTLRALAADGAVYRAGATVGFPSLSAPGHATAGTGAWPGHHGVVSNSIYGRAEGALINPFDVLTDLPGFLREPERLHALYARIFTGDAETLADALRRARPDAYTAVLNELTIGGADYTSLDHFGAGPKVTLDEARAVDRLGVIMVGRLLGDPDTPVPELLQLSLISTDSAGETAGPHSDRVRETLATIDAQLAQIRDHYARRGALDRTMWLLVSDHGMELQDPARATNLGALVRQSGVRTRHVGAAGVWLATLAVTAEATPDGLAVTVTAHDTGEAIEGATVRCDGCEDTLTDVNGIAMLSSDAIDTIDAIDVTHPQFNPQRAPLD